MTLTSITDLPGRRVARFLPRGPCMGAYSYQLRVVNTSQAFGVDLVRQAQAGDDGAFAALLRPVVPAAYRLAGAMLHDPHAAEDIVQDASLKAWRKLDQLKAGREMQPWFLGIVANECRSLRRSRW